MGGCERREEPEGGAGSFSSPLETGDQREGEGEERRTKEFLILMWL